MVKRIWPANLQGNRLARRVLICCISITVVMAAAITAQPAGAASSGKSILIFGPTLNGGPQNEQTLAEAAGYTVTVADAATWSSMTTAQFSSYNAIVFGDPTCGADPSILDPAVADQSTWAAAVTGPIVAIGTDPVYHQSQPGVQATQLITDGINAAASGSGTGVYADLSCYYANASPNTPVPLLIAFGNFTVEAGATGCDSDINIVDPANPVVAGITNSGLGGWGCSVHEVFDGYPSGFAPVVTDTDFSPAKPYIISNLGTCSKVTAQVAVDSALVSAMNVSGTCFAPGERVDVLLNTEAGAILLGTITAGADGNVSASDLHGVIVPRSFYIPFTTGFAGLSSVTVPVRSGYSYQLDVIGSTSGNGVSMQVQFQFGSSGTLAGVSTAKSTATVGTNCARPSAIAGPPVPLPGNPQTDGRWIENASGARVKLVSVNWYGAEQADFVPGGLDCQSIAAIAHEIGDGGFNSVRLPWSNAMLEEDPSVCSPDTLDRPCIDPAFLRANPQLMSDDALGILQTVVSALGQADVMVVLDNHTTDAQWAPGAENGVWWGGLLWDDLFGTSGPPSNWKTRDDLWKDDWIRVIGLFGAQPNVVGADLRNEPDANNSYGLGLSWGTAAGPRTRQAWGPTAEWAGNAILTADPNLLIMEGYSGEHVEVQGYNG